MSRLGITVGREPTTVNIKRLTGFVDRLAERGLPAPEIVRSRQFSFEGGYTAAGELFTRCREIEGLFCVNDQIAIGAMELARTEYGRWVPKNLSIVGFDDMPAAAWPSYNLTSIRQPVEQMVEETLRVLMGAIENDGAPSCHTIVPVELVRRGSTC